MGASGTWRARSALQRKSDRQRTRLLAFFEDRYRHCLGALGCAIPDGVQIKLSFSAEHWIPPDVVDENLELQGFPSSTPRHELLVPFRVAVPVFAYLRPPHDLFGAIVVSTYELHENILGGLKAVKDPRELGLCDRDVQLSILDGAASHGVAGPGTA